MEINGKTFQKQYRKCSSYCEHGHGIGHGPYWYKSGPGESLKYVGKNLPPEITNHLGLLKSQAAKLQQIQEDLERLEAQQYTEYRHTQAQARAIFNLRHGQTIEPELLKELDLQDFILLV